MNRTATTSAAFALALCALSAPALRAAAAPTPVRDDEAAKTKLARVGTHDIALRELNVFLNVVYLNAGLRQQLTELSPLHREQLLAEGRSAALRQIIERHLILTEARAIVDGNPAVKKALDQVVQDRVQVVHKETGSYMATHKWLQERGVTMKDYKSLLADSIILQNYLWENIGSRIRVTPDQLRHYYERNKASFGRPRRIVYRLIIVDTQGCESPDEERARAEMILNRLREGEPFAQLAEECSLDRDKTKGGLREVEAPVAPTDWLPPLCTGLEPGQCSEVLETESGYCIAKLEEVDDRRTEPFEQVQEQIRMRLQQAGLKAKQDELIEKLRRSSHVELYPDGKRVLGE